MALGINYHLDTMQDAYDKWVSAEGKKEQEKAAFKRRQEKAARQKMKEEAEGGATQGMGSLQLQLEVFTSSLGSGFSLFA